MAGKYMPMATSSRRKARKEMMVSVGVAPGLEIFQSILELLVSSQQSNTGQ